MDASPPAAPQPVTVRAVPIGLGQFLKFSGLAGTGGAAKELIADGRVCVNDAVETRRGRQLLAGDRVTYDDRTVSVALGAGAGGVRK